MDGEGRLDDIIRSTDWLQRALRAARAADPPQWLIGAGAIRTAVWNHLHGYDTHRQLADIDLAFFDAGDLSKQREQELQEQLEVALPGERWDVKNQAAVHLWYPRRFGYAVEPLGSTTDAVATWPETATCVGVRLTGDDALLIEAPFGLDDLLGLVHRRNPTRVSIVEYERRLAHKRIAQRWPQVTVIPAR